MCFEDLKAWPGGRLFVNPWHGHQRELLATCAELFSNHYGVWGESAKGRPYLKPNGRIRMNATRLKTVLLSKAADKTVLSRCTIDGVHVAHAFATIWNYGENEETVLWVTQLVVHRAYRRQYIATALLQELKRHPFFAQARAVGIVSSQPASCNALAKLAGPKHVSMGTLDLSFMSSHAHTIICASPVEYLKSAALMGSAFSFDSDEVRQQLTGLGVVSVANTDFPVDHAEPDAALAEYQARGEWCLGVLPECCEFLVILPVLS